MFVAWIKALLGLNRKSKTEPRWNGRIGFKVELDDGQRSDAWYGSDENNVRLAAHVHRVLGVLLPYLGQEKPTVAVELQSGTLNQYRCHPPKRIEDAQILLLFTKPIEGRDLPGSYADLDVRYGDRHRRLSFRLSRSAVVHPRVMPEAPQ